MTTTVGASGDMPSEDRNFKRELGFWHLTGIALGGVIGSGWLLGPMRAAKEAGPAAIIPWVVGGVALVLMSLVLVELGASVPLSGGLVRWPFHSSGRLVGTLAGWSIWVAYAINPPSEAAAMMQYLSKYLPGLYGKNDRLTTSGILLGLAIVVFFVLVNWFGIRLFAQVNLVLTIAKFAVPVITMAALFASGFHTGNISDHGGFAPSGYDAALSATTTTGVIFAYTGFQGPLDLAGEAKNAKRDIPRAVVTALLVSMVIYMALQVAFIGALPGSELVHGWHGIDMKSPFTELAVLLNFTWLSWTLSATAVVSPGGSAMVYTAESGRTVFAMGLNGLLPNAIAKVNRRSGIPRRALVVNSLIGAATLLSLKEWNDMVALASALTLFGYSISLVSEQAIRRRYPRLMAGWVGGTSVIAPVSFVVTSLLFYWSTWGHLKVAGVVLLIALAAYGWERLRHGSGVRDLTSGLWVIGYLLALFAVSKLGNYGGTGLIPKPFDSILAALTGLAGYRLGLRGAATHLAAQEPLLERLSIRLGPEPPAAPAAPRPEGDRGVGSTPLREGRVD